MAKKNPLKLNALQLRTLTILQQMARSPNHAKPGDEEGRVLVTNFPKAHGNHFHVGDAVVLDSDAGALGNPTAFDILEGKALLRPPHTICPRVDDRKEVVWEQGESVVLDDRGE